MSTNPLRVGILGCAGIASKTALAISNPATNCVVRAVASRSAEKAEKFVKDVLPEASDVEIMGGPTGYLEMLKSDSLDAVYIPLPTVMKKEWAIKALQAGKHVVLEKPVGLSAAEFQEMLDVAYAQKKFILDGTMFAHHGRTDSVLECVSDEHKFGTVNRIESSFTFMTDAAFQESNIRARKDGDPQGCVGDLGWYCIRYAQLVFGKLGSKVKSAQVFENANTKHGVPFATTCIVRFEGGKVLSLYCGFDTAFRQSLEICGSKKSILIDDFVIPVGGKCQYTLSSSGLTNYAALAFHERDVVECDNESVQEVLLWKHFAEIARAIDGAPVVEAGGKPSHWAGNTDLTKQANGLASDILTNQRIVDALIESLENGCKSVEISG